MIKRTAIVFVTAIVILLPARDATAVEPISTPELAEHYAFSSDEPEGKDAIFCIRYVQGFTDDSVLSTLRTDFPCEADDDQ